MYSVIGKIFSPAGIVVSGHANGSARGLHGCTSIRTVVLQVFLSIATSSKLPGLMFLQIFASVAVDSFQCSTAVSDSFFPRYRFQ